jgi:thiol-disulfide isomerase/thioredoxin
MRNKLLFLILMSLFGACSKKGERVPEFSLETVDGIALSDKTLEGKIVVIDVWATWCGNCLNELPELNKLAEKYKQDSTVMFIAVSDETIERVCSFLERRPYNFTQIPLAEKLTTALQTRLVKTYPQHIVLGKDLTIEFEHTGEMANASEVLSKEIERLR